MKAPHKAVYMVGIGGMGMAPLAIFLRQAGVRVIGDDDNFQPRIQQLLIAAGVTLSRSVQDVDAVIRSSAVSQSHPSCLEAEASGLPVYLRGHYIAELARQLKLVAIAGSHGKTTTAAMLICCLKSLGMDFSYLNGGLFQDSTLPADFSASNDWLVAEIDESDGTIDAFVPAVTVLVNADWDHPDYYASARALQQTYRRLCQATTQAVVLPASCAEILPADASAKPVCVADAKGLNATNRLLAEAAANYLTGKTHTLDAFRGLHRRQERLYADASLEVISDYAHHPAEIAHLLEWVNAGDHDVTVVFQPHRYTRTQQFAEDFRQVLQATPNTLLMPIYAAGETPIEDVCSQQIVGDMSWPVCEGNALMNRLSVVFANPATCPRKQLLCFIGAGDIDHYAREFACGIAALRKFAATVSPDTVLRLAVPMANMTTLRLGGVARYYAEPGNTRDLVALMATCRNKEVDTFFVGRGSNLIVSDDGYNGMVLSLKQKGFCQIERLDTTRIRVGAGTRLKELCGFTAANGMTGFEFLEGIPGTIGGSLRMNAGAMGGWIFDLVESVDIVTADGELITIHASVFDVGYRYCAQLVDGVAVSAVMRSLGTSETKLIRQKIMEMAARRKASQPREPSAGCIFKNPTGDHAGRLIDAVGLKGTRVGGASVSEVHANFIVNKGGATCEDVLELINLVRERVSAQHKIELEPEALLVGRNWEDVL